MTKLSASFFFHQIVKCISLLIKRHIPETKLDPIDPAGGKLYETRPNVSPEFVVSLRVEMLDLVAIKQFKYERNIWILRIELKNKDSYIISLWIIPQTVPKMLLLNSTCSLIHPIKSSRSLKCSPFIHRNLNNQIPIAHWLMHDTSFQSIFLLRVEFRFQGHDDS